MKKTRKKDSGPNKGVLSKINDNPDQKRKGEASDGKKGILSKVNGEPERKK